MKLPATAVRICLAFLLSLLLVSCGPKKPSVPELQPLRIACLGDSITSGYKLTSPEKDAYPAQLAALSQGIWQVSNDGESGVTVLKRGDRPIWEEKIYSRMKRQNPEVVVLLLGTNDTKNRNWQHIRYFSKDYRKLIRALQKMDSKPSVYVCSLPPILKKFRKGFNNERAAQLSQQIKEVAVSMGVGYIDLRKPLAGRADLFFDGLHPNKAGAKMIAETVFFAVAQGEAK